MDRHSHRSPGCEGTSLIADLSSAAAWQPDAIRRVARQWRRHAGEFAAHAVVCREAGARLHRRLDLLTIEPRRILDLGCRDGHDLGLLAARYPDAWLVGVDPAPPYLPRRSTGWAWRRRRRIEVLAADPHRLPLAEASVDLVVSNLLLPYCHSPGAVFDEVARVLTTGGAFLFSSAGPDTLLEYRAAWSRVDRWPHVFGLRDMHELGDAMLASGFDAPVLDRENLRVEYPSIDALQEELQAIGAGNLAYGRRTGLMSPQVRVRLREEAARLPVGRVVGERGTVRFAVTLELLQGHAWKGSLQTPPGRAGEQRVALDTLRRSLRRSRGGA